MSWNDPDDNDRDPWGNRRNDDGPPDLDEVVRKMQEKIGGLFGGVAGWVALTARPPVELQAEHRVGAR